MSDYKKDVLKGISIAVKATSKAYPFIVGFELNGDVNKYEYSTYIDLIIDLQKLSDLIGKPIVKKMSDRAIVLDYFFSNISPLAEKEKWEKEWTESYNLKKEIENKINTMYASVPDELSLNNRGIKRTISISEFIKDKKNPE